jgi:hypothetical protein
MTFESPSDYEIFSARKRELGSAGVTGRSRKAWFREFVKLVNPARWFDDFKNIPVTMEEPGSEK